MRCGPVATSDLIAFVRARLDNTIIGKPAEDAMRKIVDEYERVDRHYAEIVVQAHPTTRAYAIGHRMGMEHAVVALADMWRDHPDWRGGWW